VNGPHSVGASLLAMDVNDIAVILDKRGVLKFFASRAYFYRGQSF
jgi:hypothetical protein